jgi:hypothetical protein
MVALDQPLPIDGEKTLDVVGDRAFAALIRDLARDPATFNTRVSPHDEMYLFVMDQTGGKSRTSLFEYFTTGYRIFDTMHKVVDWYFGGFHNVGKMLEFASGYGRATRFLVQHMPPERVWVCDIYGDAMDFQRRWLGVNAVVSVPGPDQFPPRGMPAEGELDFLFACSFFSHMPESTWALWLSKLYRLVSSTGAMAFSVLDIAGAGDSIASSQDFHFIPVSESRTLDAEQYGVTFVSEDYVRRTCRQVLPPNAAVHRIPRGINYHQDLYIIANDPGRDLASLRFAHHPIGYIDGWKDLLMGRSRLSGWAYDPNPGGEIKDVWIAINGETVGRCRPSHPREDVAKALGSAALRSGWHRNLWSSRWKPHDVVMVKAVNSHGIERVLSCETYRPS